MREYDMFICDYVLINTAARLPPALVDVCRARHGPLSGACAAGFVSLAEKSLLEKNLGPFCCHKNTSFCMTCYIVHVLYIQ